MLRAAHSAPTQVIAELERSAKQPYTPKIMKSCILIIASVLALFATYIVDSGQRLTVRVGHMDSADLVRRPSVEVVRLANSLDVSADSVSIMTALHGLYAQLLFIIVILVVLLIFSVVISKKVQKSSRSS